MAKLWYRFFIFLTLVILPFPWVHGFLRTWSDQRVTHRNLEAVYVWGDSQVLYGLDLDQLRLGLKRDVYSLAADSAGLYDLDVFLDRIPVGSELVIGVNEEWVGRPPMENYNRSGFSLNGLKHAAECDYSSLDLYHLILQNRNPFKSSVQTHSMPLADEKKMNDTVYKIYKDKAERARPLYYQKRWDWVDQILARTKKLEHKVVWVEFPLSSRVQKVRDENSKTKFSKALQSKLPAGERFLTLQLSTDEFFSDDTHLNFQGRSWATKKLIQKFIE